MLLENPTNTKTCTWTNFWVWNSFPDLVFRILENLTISVTSYPQIQAKRAKHVFLHKMLLENPRNTKTCIWTNFVVNNSYPVLVFRLFENLTIFCDVISPNICKKGAKHVLLHKKLLEKPRNLKTCAWTNFWVENTFAVLGFRINKI